VARLAVTHPPRNSTTPFGRPVLDVHRWASAFDLGRGGKEEDMTKSQNNSVRSLDHLVGDWTTEATHPAFPSTVVHGHVSFEWLEGEKFLIVRARADHPDFPDSISIIGDTESLRMHYFDSRGVYRVYEVRLGEESWELSRDEPGFSQRFTGRFQEGGAIIDGLWKLSRVKGKWEDDLRITYRRVSTNA
jgi:hypothetical protein